MSDKKRPQDRWNEKNGYISKNFKMYRKTAEAFRAACEKAGVSQSGKIVELMEEFVREQENK